jgi:adenosylmethionine---8-amino-7-oxononanoate aminotransferase
MQNDLLKITDPLHVDQAHIWHPFTPLVTDAPPIFISSGEGIYLYTNKGERIIDAVSSWWVNIHGHSNKRIAEAIFRQATTLEHVIFAGFTHEPAIRLTQNLLSILPENQRRVFFSDNGSTAVEVAVKMAMQYWHNQGISKKRIIALEGSYHGDTFGSMSVGARGPFTRPFDPYLFNVDFIPVPTDDNISEVLLGFEKLLATGDVAAFIFEPLVQGAAGMVMYKPEHLMQLLAIANNGDVVTIADEVFTGFGRTGKLFASGYLDSNPDIIAMSKGITGGTLPLGVTSCSSKIELAFIDSEFQKTFFHGHSYTANPIACAAANASFAILMEEECQRAIGRICQQQAAFAEHLKNHNKVRRSRTCGTILALEIETGSDTSYFNEIRKQIYPYFLDRGILLRPLGNVIYVLPPYVIQPKELDYIYSQITAFLDQLRD